MSLEVRGLRAGYGRLEVLHDVDISVGSGELVAVIGSNGAGKTTLLRAVSGLLRPAAGSVVVDGTDVTGLPAEKIAARGLAHVPENRLVFPTLSVTDNLVLGGWTRRGAGKAATALDREWALGFFPRLAQRTSQRAGTSSRGGGARQPRVRRRAISSIRNSR